MSAPVFKGYATTSKDWTKFEVIDFTPQPMQDDMVELDIKFCGICGSDVHTITGGWGDVPDPLIAGHEVAGIVRAVGPKVTEFKVGDRVLVGAQVDSCRKCNPCPKQVDTYNAPSLYNEKIITQGGYSTVMRSPELFTFKIPDSLPLEDAAPMACAGLTVFGPMYRFGVKEGHKVAIAGIGGLGHFAVMFAAAMGAEVTVLTHSKDKVEDVKKMGAKHVILTSEDGWSEKHALEFDFVLNTIDVSKAIPLTELTSLLKVNGRLHICSMPDDELPAFKSQALAANGATIGVNHIGSKKEANAMLKLAAEKGIRTWKEIIPMSEVSKGVQGVKDNSVRYRYVMKQDITA
ncbi:Alcohol dehydrogenase [Rhodosporidiobolus nylandii]